MNKKGIILLLSVFFFCLFVSAQEVQNSDQQTRSETGVQRSNVPGSRSSFIHAFNDCANKGQIKEAVENGVKVTALYYKDNLYKEAFEFLRRVEQTINSSQESATTKAALLYTTTKERLQMYIKLRKSDKAKEQMNNMEVLANRAGDEKIKNDLLYNKALYYYSFGHNDEGNAVFREMASKLTADREYDKVDEVYQTLIANGRRSNNANLVAQSYSNYIVWKDSVNELKRADEIGALKKQIADNEASIDEKDSSLTARSVIITGLTILAVALAAALAIGAVILMRFIVLTRKQKKAIQLAKDNDALKAKFISNISAQLDPTLQKLDSSKPEVKALMDFSSHIQTLSELQNSADEDVEVEDVQIQSFCEGLMEEIRSKVKSGVNLKVNAPKMTAAINKEYVSHILRHLLYNAALYTPESGTITIDFKKRSAHAQQFLVSDTGCGIPEEKRDDVFKPFLEIRDLTTGDGLGLPICKQMAQKMKGDLEIDPEFTKGTRFVLSLHA